MSHETDNAPVILYSEDYNVDLGTHVFPSIKFGHIHKRILRDSRFQHCRMLAPSPVTESEILLVHGRAYLSDLLKLRQTPRTHRSELPLNEVVLRGFMVATGGTVEAARQAAEHGSAINLGGGFHHAFRDHAEGFCYLNDVAIAVRVLQREKKIRRILIVDLDVHQGNGTAKIFSWDRNVYTFSMHEENNYPIKQKSTLDVGLKTGLGDADYLAQLAESLDTIGRKFEPDLIFYVAGVDVYEKDRLGGLSLTRAGIRERDRMVRDFRPGVPIVTVLAGGYAIHDSDTVELHLGTCEVMARAR